MKVYRKEKIGRGLWGIVCPRCGMILASASEREFLPEFSTCKNCEEKKP